MPRLFAEFGKLVFCNDTKVPNDPYLEESCRSSEVAECVFQRLGVRSFLRRLRVSRAIGHLRYFRPMALVVVLVDFSFFFVSGHFV